MIKFQIIIQINNVKNKFKSTSRTNILIIYKKFTTQLMFLLCYE